MVKTLQNLLLQSYSTTETSLSERYDLWLAQLVNSPVTWLEAYNIFFTYIFFDSYFIRKKLFEI
jgi:hypothetical protein